MTKWNLIKLFTDHFPPDSVHSVSMMRLVFKWCVNLISVGETETDVNDVENQSENSFPIVLSA